MLKLVQRVFNPLCHDLEKFLRACSAAVVHLELVDPSVGIELDHLYILAPYVNHRRAIWKQEARFRHMGFYFSDRRDVVFNLQQVAAIARGKDGAFLWYRFQFVTSICATPLSNCPTMHAASNSR